MKVTYAIAQAVLDPFITIHAKEKSTTITDLGTAIEDLTQELEVRGYQNGRIVRIPLFEVLRFHTESKKVVCETTTGTYVVHQRIYALVEQLPARLFIQISSAEIVRISSIRNFVLTSTGLIQVNLTDGSQTFASRRYTQQLKRRLLK